MSGEKGAAMLSCVALMLHPDRPAVVAYAAKAERFFRERGIRVLYLRPGEETPHPLSAADEKGGEPGDRLLIMTFGGDGTLLLGAGHAMRWNAPLLGINLGTLGFLTEGDPGQLPAILERLVRGDFDTEERTLLQVRVNEEQEVYHALNDAVVTRGGFARMIRVDACVNDEYLGTYTADGLIAATPTGSTGYSLSAGGPVVAPGVRSTLITPVCPHSFQHSSFLVPDKALIRFRLWKNRVQSAVLQIDGQHKKTLEAGDTVYITGAENTLRLVRLAPCRFFTLTRRKLSEWTNSEEREETT